MIQMTTTKIMIAIVSCTIYSKGANTNIVVHAAHYNNSSNNNSSSNNHNNTINDIKKSQ